MTQANLPARANLQFLKKLAKERLTQSRADGAPAKLADAQRDVAREYGFPSWRQLKAHVDKLHAPPTAEQADRFFDAISRDDAAAVRDLIRVAPTLLDKKLGRSSHTPLSWATTVNANEG